MDERQTKGDEVERTGCTMTEARGPSTHIVLADDGVRQTNAGDADDAEPLAQRVRGLEGAGMAPATCGMGLRRCCAGSCAGRGGRE